MNSLNSVLVEGELTADPVLEQTSAGTPICRMEIVSTRSFNNGDSFELETSMFDVEARANLAETCSEHLTKGRNVRCIGRLKQDRWTTADGVARCGIKVVAEHVEFRPSRRNNG